MYNERVEAMMERKQLPESDRDEVRKSLGAFRAYGEVRRLKKEFYEITDRINQVRNSEYVDELTKEAWEINEKLQRARYDLRLLSNEMLVES